MSDTVEDRAAMYRSSFESTDLIEPSISHESTVPHRCQYPKTEGYTAVRTYRALGEWIQAVGGCFLTLKFPSSKGHR